MPKSRTISRLIGRNKVPCVQCPYKLGLIKTLVNPCPQCKLNGYRTFEQFQKQLFMKDKGGRYVQHS